MTGISINNLPPVTSAQLTDVFPIVQANITYQESINQLVVLLNTLFLQLSGGILTGTLTLNADPVSALQAATKQYVDTVAQGISVQGACRVGTTGALTVIYDNGAAGVGATLTNDSTQDFISLDGVSLDSGDRVLVKNQASTFQNGIYIVTNIGSGATNWILTRATDYDLVSQINPGDLVIITAGTTLSKSSWIETAIVTAIGTDPIVFVQFSASLPISLANGGTGASLVASNGSLFYSTSTVGALLATSNNGILKTDGSGIPSISTTTPSALNIPQPNIIGVVNGSSAASGSVGEYIESFIDLGTPITLTTLTPANVTSIILTAGDWDVSVIGGFNNVSAANVSAICGASSISATIPAGAHRASLGEISFLNVDIELSTVPIRFNISSPTTVYLVVIAEFSAGTMEAYGLIRARRMR